MSNDPLSINVKLVPVKYRSVGPYFFFLLDVELLQAAGKEAQELNSNTTSHALIREQMEEMEGRKVSHGKAAGDEWIALCWLFGACWYPQQFFCEILGMVPPQSSTTNIRDTFFF